MIFMLLDNGINKRLKDKVNTNKLERANQKVIKNKFAGHFTLNLKK